MTALADELARLAGGGGEPAVLADDAERVVVRRGGVVAKAHAPDTDAALLAARVRAAAGPALSGIVLPPLAEAPVRLDGGRAATLWPAGAPVDPEHPVDAPWAAAGELLARLHAVPVPAPGSVPPMRAPERVARAVARMRAAGGDDAARRAVEAAWAGLETWCLGSGPLRPRALCHGDFHLGQLVRHPAPDGPWLLIDIDDLGLGDPVWDLARPAAWYASGLLAPEHWELLLGAYQTASGTRGADPWPALDLPARAVTVQLAAVSLARAGSGGDGLDEDDAALFDACVRMSRLPAGEPPRTPVSLQG